MVCGHKKLLLFYSGIAAIEKYVYSNQMVDLKNHNTPIFK